MQVGAVCRRLVGIQSGPIICHVNGPYDLCHFARSVSVMTLTSTCAHRPSRQRRAGLTRAHAADEFALTTVLLFVVVTVVRWLRDPGSIRLHSRPWRRIRRHRCLEREHRHRPDVHPARQTQRSAHESRRDDRPVANGRVPRSPTWRLTWSPSSRVRRRGRVSRACCGGRAVALPPVEYAAIRSSRYLATRFRLSRRGRLHGQSWS